MSLLSRRTRFFGNGMFGTIVQTMFFNVFILAVTVLTTVITARMLGVEGRGVLAAALFWPGFLSSLINLGLPNSLIYHTKKGGKDNIQTYLLYSVFIQFPASVVVGGIAWWQLPAWMAKYPPVIIELSQSLIVFHIFLLLATNLLLAVFQSLDKFKIYNLIRFSVPTFNIIGLVLLWQLGKLTVYSAILNNFLVSFLVTVWAIYLMIREIKDKWKWEWKNSLLVPFTRYGLRVFILELLGVLSGQLDKIIIITLLTPREFGLYSVAFTLSRVFNVLQTAVSNVIFPKVTGLDQSDIVTKVSRGFRISMIIMGMIIIPFILLGPFLIQLFLGKNFISSSFIFYLLSWECVIGGGSWILAQAFNALGRPGLIVIRQAIALIVTVGLFFILAPIWGLIGISIALLTGAMIRLAITLVSFPIVLKIPLKQVIYNKDDYQYLKSVLNLKRRGLV